ncbi:hypothetical protein M3484_22895 [Pseudomonas sp. GX19020]|uniref:hypothetical protein n=1 Tax=Pseudomonas sp. GX19020 TaxID=2942277 RepID=UPI002018A390|nr:hypothetical protein [Pseudomonas sp. GX19020]MCL4069410.1 hypothetical protein [Pseudomonas sp. GX19020]
MTKEACPSDIDKFAKRHSGQDVVVCGLGQSIVSLMPFIAEKITIGVNDIGRHLTPNYLVLQDYPSAFLPGRLEIIQKTKASCAFTSLDFPNLQARKSIKIELADRDGNGFGRNGKFSYSGTSVYLSTCLAAFLGATRIALAGVDFSGPSRQYDQSFVDRTNRSFEVLCISLLREGRQLLNLSKSSRIITVPHMDPVDFFCV